MATHFFDVDIAIEYGVNAAIILQNIKYWVDHNRANDANFYDGRYWTFNSIKAFSELFPYMSGKTIRNAISKLEEAGLIVIGNYNKVAYDRTKWYALTDKAEALFQNGNSICQKGQMDFADSANGSAQKGEPIPDINTDCKTQDNKHIYVEIVDYLNAKAGTRYRASTASTRKHIKARLDEGFTVEDFKSVIDKKCSEWLGNSKMEQYLRPETLFGTKFEGYLNAKVNVNRQEKGANGVDLRPLEPDEDTSWFPRVSTSNI